ncbi:MAG: molybdopterin-synthase adenylyltransferase MoeB [Methanosarcinaceae archaeon]|nr:molybdopterin-synthase adenylyltransferase MoeB [Methanosarcinaceae archaeon]
MTGGLNDEQRRRYARHIVLPDIGEDGQIKLLGSSVLCIGAGGLGSPVIQYLAAAGVGTLGIADDDIVDFSNLQRQVIHAGNLDLLKVESAAEFVRKLNTDVTVKTYEDRITPDNIMDIITDYDMVVDASDNFATRYLMNDACVLAGKPLAHGSIFQFEGQVMTILPHEGPCYRCLFEKAPPPEMTRTCQEAGVIGVLPGVIGVIQATEVIKYLIGIGELLAGRMIYYDALKMTFDEISIKKNPNCPLCGEDPRITFIESNKY